MFSIYGVTGRSFHGPLEALRAVPGALAARNARGIGKEGEELGPEQLGPEQLGPPPVRPEPGARDQEPYRQAAEAYRKMLNAEHERGPIRHAYQLMTRDVLTLRPEATVVEAWYALAGPRLGQAPVLDSARRLVGQVSTWDLLTVINIEEGVMRDILQRRVADVMTSPVVSVDPVSDIRRVAQVLLDQRLSGMPVMTEHDELVGIITRSDILRALANDPPLSLWA